MLRCAGTGLVGATACRSGRLAFGFDSTKPVRRKRVTGEELPHTNRRGEADGRIPFHRFAWAGSFCDNLRNRLGRKPNAETMVSEPGKSHTFESLRRFPCDRGSLPFQVRPCRTARAELGRLRKGTNAVRSCEPSRRGHRSPETDSKSPRRRRTDCRIVAARGNRHDSCLRYGSRLVAEFCCGI